MAPYNLSRCTEWTEFYCRWWHKTLSEVSCLFKLLKNIWWSFIEISSKFQLKFHWNFQWSSIEVSCLSKLLWNFTWSLIETQHMVTFGQNWVIFLYRKILKKKKNLQSHLKQLNITRGFRKKKNLRETTLVSQKKIFCQFLSW